MRVRPNSNQKLSVAAILLRSAAAKNLIAMCSSSLLLLSARGLSYSGLWPRQKLTLGRRMLRLHIALALLHYLLCLMTMTNPHIVRLCVAVDDRLPLMSAPLQTSEWESVALVSEIRAHQFVHAPWRIILFICFVAGAWRGC